MSARDALAVFDALLSIARSRKRLLRKKAARSEGLHPETECALDRIDYVLDRAADARVYLVAQASAETLLGERSA